MSIGWHIGLWKPGQKRRMCDLSRNPGYGTGGGILQDARRKIRQDSDTGTFPVCRIEDAVQMQDKIDVMILCGGKRQGIRLAIRTNLSSMQYFNVIDSFDTPCEDPEHFTAVDEAAKKERKGRHHFLRLGSGHVFTEPPVRKCAVTPRRVRDYTFWGKGVSQGHSDAIRPD